MKPTREALLAQLRALGELEDAEVTHQEADMLLLDYIDDEEIRSTFKALTRWYA